MEKIGKNCDKKSTQIFPQFLHNFFTFFSSIVYTIFLTFFPQFFTIFRKKNGVYFFGKKCAKNREKIVQKIEDKNVKKIVPNIA